MGRVRIEYAGWAAQVDLARQSAVRELWTAIQACQGSNRSELDLKVARAKMLSSWERGLQREWDFDLECFNLVDSAYGTAKLGRNQSTLINNAVGAIANANSASTNFRQDRAAQQRARALANNLGLRLKGSRHRPISKSPHPQAGLFTLTGNKQETRYRPLDRIMIELMALSQDPSR